MVSSDTTTIPDEWKPIRLGDIAEVRSGSGFPLSRQGRRNGQYPFIKVSDMTLNGNEVLINCANNFVDERDVEELKATILPPGTIVFPKVGAAISTNKKRVLNMPTIIDNNMVGVTVKDGSRCDARFLHAWFESIDLTKLANVSAVPSITSSRLKREWISLPPLAEQTSIATTLGSIGDAIDSTSMTVTATKNLRDSLLHELLTRGVPGWHTEWQNVTGVGIVPVDWQIVRLGEVCGPPKYGTYLETCPYDPVLPRYVRITDIGNYGQLGIEGARSVKYDGSEYSLDVGDLLFSVRGSIGRTYLYKSKDGSCIYSGNLMRFRPNSLVVLPEFVSQYAHSVPCQRWIASMSRVGAQPSIMAKDLSLLPIPLPSLSEQRAIVALFDVTEEVLLTMRQELLRLAELKTSMLDSLLTGSLRVTRR